MSRDLAVLPSPPDRVPDVEDDFSGPLRIDLWVDHSCRTGRPPDRSAARYETTATGLRPRIDAGQLDW